MLRHQFTPYSALRMRFSSQGCHDRKVTHGRGFSMIELLITMVIASILLGVAIPSFKTSIQLQQTRTEATNLMNDLQFARSEAEKEGQSVTVCASTDNVTCAAAGTAWNTGWIIFSDAAGNQVFNSGTDVLLRVQKAWTTTDTMTTSPSVIAITYNRDGFATSIPTTGQLFLVHNSPASTSTSRCLWMDTIGHQQIQTAGQALATNQTVACS